MAVAQGSKPMKKATAPKKSKDSPSHPPYIEMIKEAFVALKERTGSSQYAIAKHIEEQQKVRDLPSNFKKLLSVQLKRFVASGKLVKVKNSYKLPPAAAKNSPALAVDSKAKPKKVVKKKEGAAKPKATAPAKSKSKEKKTAKAKSPAKKVVTGKKVAPAKAKKPKSIKSPVKKSAVTKKAKK